MPDAGPAHRQTIAETQANTPQNAAHHADNATCPKSTNGHGPSFLMMAGNQLSVDTQKITPDSQAHPNAAFGALRRTTSMSGTNASHTQSARACGGKAAHSTAPLVAAAMPFITRSTVARVTVSPSKAPC
jgi:hypothetical protein